MVVRMAVSMVVSLAAAKADLSVVAKDVTMAALLDD